MALEQNAQNISVLFLVCSETEDVDWTRSFIYSLKQIGVSDIYSTTDFQIGASYFEKLKTLIRKVQNIIIVLSKTSSRSNAFKKTIDCTMAVIMNEKLPCGTVPVLLDDNVEMPFLLECYKPFLFFREDISLLIQSLLFISEEQAVRGYVNTMISLSDQSNILRRLNKLELLPDDSSRHIKRLAMSTMQNWGVSINDKCLTVDMNKLQNCAAYQRLCLNDLFRHFNGDDAIRVIRVTGVKKFDLQTLFENGQVYNDLIKIYKGIFEAATKDKHYRYWYQYRRNGLVPADRAELAYKPLSDARAEFSEGKPHSPEFQMYKSRLQSLTNFPIQSRRVKELIAESGSFSVNNLDYIQCFHCGACLRTWNIDASDHSFYFQNCALSEKKLEISERLRSKEFQEHSIVASFDNYTARMYTYRFISNENNIKHLIQFALAGFYYLGTKEDTLCYSCYLGLTKIKEYENPWEVHYRFSPNCKHLKTLDEDTLRVFEVRRQLCSNSGDFMPYLEVEIMLHN